MTLKSAHIIKAFFSKIVLPGVFLSLFLGVQTLAASTKIKHVNPLQNIKEDANLFFEYMLKGSLHQFKNQDSLLGLSLATPFLLYSAKRDKIHFEKNKKNRKNSLDRILETTSIFMTFPFLGLSTYQWGQMSHNPKLIEFSIQYLATLYISLIESSLLSHIHIHNRPNENHLSFFEKEFRGQSSFPSGHVIPLAALTFKLVEMYPSFWNMIPAIGTIFVGFERIRNQKHYLSDVIGGILLAYLASRGVYRYAQLRKSQSQKPHDLHSTKFKPPKFPWNGRWGVMPHSYFDKKINKYISQTTLFWSHSF